MKGKREKGEYCLSCDVFDFFRSLEGMSVWHRRDNSPNGYAKGNFNNSGLNELWLIVWMIVILLIWLYLATLWPYL